MTSLRYLLFYDYCVTGSNADILCPRRAVRYSHDHTPSVALSPIADGQVDQVAEFLHRELNPRVTTKAWAEGIKVQWVADAPNRL